MLRKKMISIPEGVYYRGRFRATMVWSKVSKDRRGDAVDAIEESQSANESGHPRSGGGLTADGAIVTPVTSKGLLLAPSQRPITHGGLIQG